MHQTSLIYYFSVHNDPFYGPDVGVFEGIFASKSENPVQQCSTSPATV
jgi:hypothetical protein